MKPFDHFAMNCDWQLAIFDQPPAYAASMARAAFEEVDRLERDLSRFVDVGDVSRVNSAPVGRPVLVGIDLLECLALARRVHDRTRGALDVTIGRLVPARGGSPAIGTQPAPSDSEGDADEQTRGMHHLAVDRVARTVTRLRESVCIDLGAVGKGYAVDRAVEILREWGAGRVVLHSGGSSVYVLGPADDGRSRSIPLRDPRDAGLSLGAIPLQDRSLSGSANVGKAGHIIDPRTGRAASADRCAWVAASSAALGDALSTAAMILQPQELESLFGRPSAISAGSTSGATAAQDAGADGLDIVVADRISGPTGGETGYVMRAFSVICSEFS